MTLIDAIRQFIRTRRDPVHLQDLYAHLPDALEHSIRAGIYERLGKEFKRVGKGLYVAIDNEATCVVVEGDAWESIKEIPTGSVDALITDPPYDWLEHFVEAGTTRRRMDWKFERRDIDLELGYELCRVMKEGAHAFIFVPAETVTTRPHIEKLIATLEKAGFIFQKRWIWDKLKLGMGYSGRARYEAMLHFSRGEKRQPCDMSIPDVLDYPPLDPRIRKHPCEKPVWVLEQLIKFATRAGELVLDIFAGSCAVGRAALGLGRDSILIEKDAAVLTAALGVTDA